MGKFKVNYKMLAELSGEVREIGNQLKTQGDELRSVNGNLENDKSLTNIKKQILSGAESIDELTVGLNAIAEVMSAGAEKYQKGESSGTKKVDGARAHNRDFYKNPVSVPSAGGAAMGAAVVNVSQSSTVSASPASAATIVGGTRAASGAAAKAAAGGGLGAAALGGAAVVGAAGVAAGVAATVKKRKQDNEEAEI